MSDKYSNSTAVIVFYTTSSYINIFCTNILYCVMFCLCILSFIWAIYFIFRLTKEKHILKRQTDSTAKKNCERKIIKNKFLIAICTIEWLIMLCISSLAFSTDLRDILTPYDLHIPKIYLTNCLYETLKGNFLSKLLITFILTLLLLLIVLIRILTQYLCQEYSYNSGGVFELGKSLKFAIVVLVIFFLIGLVRQLIIFQWVICCAIFAFEFVSYVKANKELNNCLKKRSFDALNHENQPIYIVKLYRRVEFEYKISSNILVAALFSHTCDLIAFTIYSILWLVLSSPSNWFDILFSNENRLNLNTLPEDYQQTLNIFATAFSDLELLAVCFGWSLFVIPYFIISLNKLLRASLKAFAKDKDYKGHSVIQAQIQKRNIEYNILRN